MPCSLHGTRKQTMSKPLPRGTVTPLMPHAERRKLIEAPFSYIYHPSHYAHCGISVDDYNFNTMRRVSGFASTLDTDNYEI